MKLTELALRVAELLEDIPDATIVVEEGGDGGFKWEITDIQELLGPVPIVTIQIKEWGG